MGLSQAYLLLGGHNGDSLELREQRAIDGLAMITSSCCVEAGVVGKVRGPALRELIQKASGSHRLGSGHGFILYRKQRCAQPCYHLAVKTLFPGLLGLCLSVLCNPGRSASLPSSV